MADFRNDIDSLIRKKYENQPGLPEFQTLPTDGPGSDASVPDNPLVQRQRAIVDHYRALSAANMRRQDFLPPTEADEGYPLTDVVELVAGAEMSALGMKFDEQGFDWSWDRFKENWSEHPIMNTAAVAAWSIPGAAAAYNKIARTAKFANISDEALKSYGMIDNVEDARIMPESTKRKLQAHVYQMQRNKELDELVQQGLPGDASLKQRAKYAVSRAEWAFRKRFANTYANHMNPNTVPEKEAYVKRIQTFMESDEFNRHLANLPDEKHGAAIARALIDADEMRNLPDNVKPFVVTLRDDLQRFQREALEEGFIDQDTFEHVGDVWIPLYREGTPLTQQGPLANVFRTAGKGKKKRLQTINLPRTGSPSLIKRKTTKGEAISLLRKQEAAEALERGNSTKAINALKGEEFTDAKELIRQGETDEALSLLRTESPLMVSPEQLTVGGLLQQKMLLENFRYVRDIALNPNFIKKGSEVKAMSKGVQKEWMSLDSLENASVLRRMAGRKLGKDAVEELGYVRKDLFRGLEDMLDETASPNNVASLIDAVTAVHKTARTALNPYTHGQNILGNMVFMWAAGWNPLKPENWQILKQAGNAYYEWHRAAKQGKFLDDLPNLGKIKSVTGKEIDIAEELADPAIKSIILESNLLEAEGIQGLQRILEKSDESQMFLRGTIQATQRATKASLGPLSIENASKLYMAEDDIAKLGYYLGMRQQGMSRTAAAMEVGRRLPIYSHIGPSIRQARRFLLPWISFPTEAMRITKNNLMDHPLRTMMLFHSYKGLQGMLYPFTGESAESLRQQRENLPFYAQRPGRTVITPLKDSNENLRSLSLDWLPHTAFLPATDAKEAPLLQKMPLGLDEPAPILNGIIFAMTGKDSFGNEVALDPRSPMQDFSKTAVNGIFNFIAPPLIGKYLTNPRTPYPYYRLLQDTGYAIDPTTGKPGDPMFDMFVNNFSSFGKMYPASGEQGLANMAMYNSALDRFQSKLTKEWNTLTKNGDDVRASEVLSDINKLMVERWKDPAIAQRKFNEWLMRHEKQLRRHPKLRTYSREQLLMLLMDATQAAGETRSKAMEQRVRAIRQEIAMRGHSSRQAKGIAGGVVGGGAGGGVAGGVIR